MFGMIGRLNTDGIPLLQFEFEFAGNGQDQLKGIEAITSLPWGYEVPDLVEMQAQKLGCQRTEEEVGYKVVGLINFEDGWPFFWHKGYEREEYINPEGVRFGTSVVIWLTAGYFSTFAPGGCLAKVIGGILSLPSGYAADQLWMDMMDLEERDVKVFVGPCYLNFQQQFPSGDWQVEEWK